LNKSSLYSFIVHINPEQIRIPGKIGEARPVIVKLVNSEVKYRIMRAKKNLPKKETVNIKSESE
jgi:hypothetical protein